MLLTPGDISALASTIGNLLEDQALATEMGRRGAQKVRSELSWNTQADRTCAVFEKALSLRGYANRRTVGFISPYYPRKIGGVES